MKTPHPHSPGWMPIPSPSCTSTQRSWLLRPGALTSGLRQLGVFRLRVLAEYGHAASIEEARPMGLRPGALVWVREVMMSIDGDDCVVARSLTPLAASRSTWQGMRRLRTRPLADMLYHDRTVRRSAFECRRLARGVPFYRTLTEPQRAAGVLARRSVFWRNGMPLLVAEGFLPAFWDKAENRDGAHSRQVSGTRVTLPPSAVT